MSRVLSRLDYGVFAALLGFRIANALAIATFFQPDEYFQSLEPAWQYAFGPESGAWITWEWRERLRSSMHPVFFAVVYRLCSWNPKGSHNVYPGLLLYLPKLFQAFIAAAGDFYTWRLARKVYGLQSLAASAALALTFWSPWQFFCSTRTFSNSLETTLTIFALEAWPWQWFLYSHRPADRKQQAVPRVNAKQQHSGSKTAGRQQESNDFTRELREFLEHGEPKGTAPASNPSPQTRDPSVVVPDPPLALTEALTAAAVACILRPTNVIIWATISVCLLYRYGTSGHAFHLASYATLCGTAVLAVSSAMDRVYYGEWVFPPLRFLYINVFQGLSEFYGRNRVDYYFMEGLPLLLTTALPFALLGLWQSLRIGRDRADFRGYHERQTRFVLAVAVIATVLAFTLLAHKEVRFIYPLLPILHVLAARHVATFFDPAALQKSRLKVGLLLLMMSINVYIAAYASLVHQRGVIDVMHYLRGEQAHRLSQGSTQANLTVGFLMPCHSTPWRSHLIFSEIDAWALTCEPPVHLAAADREKYLDEADVFYVDPGQWLSNNMQDQKLISNGHDPVKSAPPENAMALRAWPEYLIFFEQLEPALKFALRGTLYKECWRGFNTHWHDDWRRQGDVVVWCLQTT